MSRWGLSAHRGAVLWLLLATPLALALAGPVTGPALAQPEEPPESAVAPDAAAAALEDLAKERAEDAGRSGTRPRPPSVMPLDALDAESRALVVERFRRYQRHQIEALEHRERLFRWQLRANQVSFVVVLVLVFAGIVFSGIQFVHSLRTASGGEGAAAQHELAIGASGVTVRSSVIGLIVLTISLGFFYLYLVHVFPLEELPTHKSPAAPSGAEVAAE